MLDYEFLAQRTKQLIDRSRKSGLMHATMAYRKHAETMIQGKQVISFTNCSYLGFDTDPEVVKAAQELLGNWGTHVCCARSRLSIEPLTRLEQRLSKLFGSPAITFPSVTSTHAAVLPLLASGALLKEGVSSRPPKFIFDRFAHASMQVLKPIIRQTAQVITIGHNDLQALESELALCRANNQVCIYLCDSVYSMGGVAPLRELLRLHDEYGLYLYVDDAHGTSIYGRQGQGYVGSVIGAKWPAGLFATFSLAKGFGCNGGGVIVPSKAAEEMVRFYGQTYSFSGPLDFAMVGAALKVLDFHEDGTVLDLQNSLRSKVALLDDALGSGKELDFSPIRMLAVGDELKAIEIGERLLERGFYVPVVFYPVVPWGLAQLRVCVTVRHEDAALKEFCSVINEMGLRLDHGNVKRKQSIESNKPSLESNRALD